MCTHVLHVVDHTVVCHYLLKIYIEKSVMNTDRMGAKRQKPVQKTLYNFRDVVPDKSTPDAL